MRRAWAIQFLRALLFATLLLAGYYLLFLRPKTVLPNAYLQAEKVLTERKNNLLQNRLSLVELTRLDPTSPSFNQEKADIFSQVRNTRETELSLLNEQRKFPKVAGAPTPQMSFLNELAREYPKLLEKEKSILERQETLLNPLFGLDSEIEKIFLYNPELDLKEDSQARAEAAINGLEVVYNNLDDLKLAQTEELQKQIRTTQGMLREFQQGRVGLDRVSSQFTSLKRQALEAEASLIRSPEVVSLLAEQTNLILEYDFWLKKLDEQQENL